MDWTNAFAGTTMTKLFLDEVKQFWIVVRDELTHGEQRAVALGAFKRVYRDEGKEEVLEFDKKAGADQKVRAYLVDWNLLGPDGKTTDISTEQAKADAISNLTPAHYAAVEQVIDAHVLAVAEKKRMTPGALTSVPMSA